MNRLSQPRIRGLLVLGGLLLLFPMHADAQSEGGIRNRDRDSRAPTERRGAGRLIQPRLVPPPRQRDRRWYLGVQVAYRDTGAEITEVVRYSPAERAGLERRDLIVTVDGYQVGYVKGRLYPLDRELDLRARRGGQVRLLVQNHRDGELTNVSVRLEPSDRPILPGRKHYLVGTVTSRRLTQLPRGARLFIELVDKSHRLGPLTPVLQKEITNLGPLPIPFELAYDPQQIDPQRQYALRAHVTVNGMVTLRTRNDYPLPGNVQPRRISLELERAR